MEQDRISSELKDEPYNPEKWTHPRGWHPLWNSMSEANSNARKQFNLPSNLEEREIKGGKLKDTIPRIKRNWKRKYAKHNPPDEGAFHTTIEKEQEDDGMDYPKVRELRSFIRQINEQAAYPSSSLQDESSIYNPPPDSVMGPPVYPPAREYPRETYTPTYQLPYKRGNFKGGYGRYYDSQWTLPPAMVSQGAMLVLPSDPGLWADVISRWESITINKINELVWPDNKSKLMFVENLLGENEKKMWQQWRTAYPDSFTALEGMADDPQNITSQIRHIILMEDPYRGSTEEQDRAYRNLERITCEDTKNIWKFINDF